MYKISSITIDGLHNASNVTYEFSNDTYIYGRNGSGKSTILQGIQFALLGYIPGSPKTKTGILSHSRNGYITVDLELQSETDSISIHRSITSAGLKANEVLVTIPQDVDLSKLLAGLDVPVFDFSEFMSLSANKRKDALASLLPASSNIVVSTYCKKLKSYNPAVDSLLNDNPCKSVRTVEDAKRVAEYFKQLQNNLVAEQKRLASTTQSLIFYDEYTDNTDPKILLEKINKLRERQNTILKIETQIAQNEEIQNKIKSLRTPAGNSLANTQDEDLDYKAVRQKAEQLVDTFNYDNECNKLQEIQDQANKIHVTIVQYQNIIASGTECPILDCTCNNLASNVARLKTQLPALEEQYDKLHSSYLDKQHDIKNKSAALDMCVNTMKQFDQVYAECRKLESLLKLVDESMLENKERISLELEALQANYAKAAANQKYQSMMNSLQKQKLELDSTLAFVKEAARAFGENGIQSNLIKKPFQDLEAQMNLVLENRWYDTSLGTPRFVIETKANSFDFGFVRNGKFLSFNTLSSGEKCCFVTLFLTTLVKYSKSSVKVVLVDDLFDHLDDTKFKNIMTTETDVQLVVAGVKDPHEFSDCFRIIHLN